MKNLFFALTLAVAGLLALPSASVREVRANAVIGTVTASSVPVAVAAIGGPPALFGSNASRHSLSYRAAAHSNQSAGLFKFIAWVSRNTCRVTVWANSFFGDATDEETIEGRDRCNEIRYSG